MGFTIKEKAFLLGYFRKRVKQENEDWPYFVLWRTINLGRPVIGLTSKCKAGIMFN
jgi:hypothetical protein